MFDDSMKFIGKGGLTKNAELSYNNNGTAFLKFSIGVSKSRKIKGTDNYEQISHYFNCVIIGKYGEKLVNHLKKGTKVYVVGDLEFNSWEQDGQKRTSIDLHVQEIEIIKKPDDNNSNSNNQNNGTNNYQQQNNSYNQGYNNQGNNQQRTNHYVSNNPDDYYHNGYNKHTGEYNPKFDTTVNS